MNETLVIGIDQGYANIGVAILGYNDTTKKISIKETVTITTKPQFSIQKRLAIIYDRINGLLENYENVKYGACERLFHNDKMKNGRNKSANIMYTNMATGAIYLLCERRKIEMYEFAPTTVKKVLTNNGRADKDEVAEAMKDLLKKYKVDVKTNHESDAIAIGITFIKKHLET